MQLCFGKRDKVSNNIAEYEGLLAGIRAAIGLGIKRLIIKGDSQLLVNFSNKVYQAKDAHMALYLEEVRKLEKRFLGLELQHIRRGDNTEADDIAKRASKQLPQRPEVFEERLYKPSIIPPSDDEAASGPRSLEELLPRAPEGGAPDCGQPSGGRLVLTFTHEEACWVKTLIDYI